MRQPDNFWKPEKNRQQELREDVETGVAEHEANKTERRQEAEMRYNQELHTTDEMFDRIGPDGIEEVYEWYRTAMERRDRVPLDEFGFIQHFFQGGSLEPTYAYGDPDKGYLLGYDKNGLFIPTHFAPKTLMGAYGLLQDLGSHKEIPSVMAITDDLAKTIAKIPSWKVFDVPFPGVFRGEFVKKKLAYNEHPDTEKLGAEILKEMQAEYSHSRENPADANSSTGAM